MAVGMTLMGCVRQGSGNERTSIATPTPTTAPTPDASGTPSHWQESLQALECKDDRVYPPDGGAIPLVGSYLIRPPVGHELCYVVVSTHERLRARLAFFDKGINMEAQIPDYGEVVPLVTVPPTEKYVIEYTFRGLSVRISLTEQGNYLVEYSLDETDKYLAVPTPTKVP